VAEGTITRLVDNLAHDTVKFGLNSHQSEIDLPSKDVLIGPVRSLSLSPSAAAPAPALRHEVAAAVVGRVPSHIRPEPCDLRVGAGQGLRGRRTRPRQKTGDRLRQRTAELDDAAATDRDERLRHRPADDPMTQPA
jgi:hypothetical protein